ncbi:NACHT, LRR and PYD domains-containing protein 12 [Chelonia mydas]|uniref:NACHT, LRR and PYD domains-containing protein 3 n=1 Tax=Chelonia mydas TaxID=8469 RepID=M7B8D8_CHEMY|nr:NACHT, LRR and PYD domains-containing protein 12 [Chelonia mydas]
MTETYQDILLMILEELAEEQRKKFKLKLGDTELRKGYANIPKGRLEKADVTDMVDLLIRYYQEEYAVEVVINVLDHINDKDLAERLRRKSAEDHRANYVASVKEKFRRVKDYNSRPGEWVSLEDHYTKLFIVKKHHQAEDKEHELLSRGKRHMEIMRKPSSFANSHVNVEDLFDTLSDGTITRKVILQGIAGIGKTATVSKIMYDWSSGRLYQGRFDYIFHWSCRELNQRTEKLSLAQLILQNWGHPKPEIGEILSCPDKVLFVIDGFDELKFPEDYDKSKSLSCDLNTPHSTAAAVVESLLSSKSLSEACLLVTTRPLAVGMLETHMQGDLWAEIVGFLEEDRKEFFKKFFKDEEKAAFAYSYIQENDVVFTMCFIPLICWIVCTTLSLRLRHSEALDQKVSTTTEIFTYFVATLLQSHGCAQTSTQDLFHNLGSLAYAGVRDQKVLFDESTLRKCNLEVSKGPSTFLTELLQADIFVETIYSFVHLTVQELFAALFTFWNKEKASELLKEAFVENKSHLILTVRFLFGLNNDKSLKPLKRYYETCMGISKNELLKWTKKALLICQEQGEQNHLLLELLHCLFEIQDEEFVISALEEIKEVVFLENNLGQDDQQVILYTLQHAKEFNQLKLGSLKERDMMKLVPLLGKCKQIQITLDNLPEDTAIAICDHVIPAHPGIVALDVNRIQGSEEFVKSLKNSLLDSDCRLESVGFNIENPRLQAFQDICQHLATYRSPRKFLLFRRYEEDEIHFGYEAKDEEKSGKSAVLACLPEECFLELTMWVTSTFTPLALCLDENSINDELMKTICENLNSTNYQLQSLSLRSCSITQESMANICSLFLCNTAVSLDLQSNPVGDEGVKLLATCLKSKGCCLEKLSLSSAALTEDCVPAITSLFSRKNTLIWLDLSFNHLGDGGVKALCSALKDKESHLEKLMIFLPTEYMGPNPEVSTQTKLLMVSVQGLVYRWKCMQIKIRQPKIETNSALFSSASTWRQQELENRELQLIKQMALCNFSHSQDCPDYLRSAEMTEVMMNTTSMDEIGLSPRKDGLSYQIFPDPSDFDRYCKLKDRLPSIVVEPTEGDVESEDQHKTYALNMGLGGSEDRHSPPPTQSQRFHTVLQRRKRKELPVCTQGSSCIDKERRSHAASSMDLGGGEVQNSFATHLPTSATNKAQVLQTTVSFATQRRVIPRAGAPGDIGHGYAREFTAAPMPLNCSISMSESSPTGSTTPAPTSSREKLSRQCSTVHTSAYVGVTYVTRGVCVIYSHP